VAPSNFFSFQRIKRKLGEGSADVKEVKRKTTEVYAEIREESSRKMSTKSVLKKLDKCISANGEYFEGN